MFFIIDVRGLTKSFKEITADVYLIFTSRKELYKLEMKVAEDSCVHTHIKKTLNKKGPLACGL